jgi:PAS domain S-box-containing protein
MCIGRRQEAEEQLVNKEKTVQTLQEKGYPHVWLFATFWTIIIVISLSWNIARQKNEIIEVATNEAKTIFEKDQVYYRWATSHKGVYVPLTDKTQSNPYLDHLPESSGKTATGLTLTLVNPEYMIRQVYEMSTGSDSALGHITSLDPIREENVADSWESEALAAFEKGEKQVSSVETIDGQPYLRLMRPMMTEGGCLKCHMQQGYALGDIRGGISVAVPMSLLFSIYRRDIVLLTLAHVPLWLLGLAGIFISSRRIAQSIRKREAAEAKTRSIINNMLDGLITMTAEGVIESLNAPACNLFGCDDQETVGKKITTLIQFPGSNSSGTEQEAALQADIRKMVGTQEELTGIRRDGSAFPIEISLSEMLVDDGILYIATVRDITEEKIRKSEALRTGQLAAIGELAAGVAHEINNPINGIINYTQLLLDNADEKCDSTDRDFMARIIKEGERIAVIVGNLLSFARQRDVIEEVSMKEIIEDSISLLMHQIQKDGIQLSVDIPADLPLIKGNPQHLQQVIINLLTNASYALNQKFPAANPDKRLEISCRPKSAMGKEYVSTTVTDWGIGIPQEIIDRIFDSLFTTKPPGKGTGLGLSLSKGLVRDHQGFLSVESTVGGPTVATVDFPVLGREKVPEKQTGTES